MARVGSDAAARFVRPDLLDLPPYVPVDPLDVLAAEYGIAEADIVKLDGNENLYGPSPRVLEELARFDAYHIYPDPDQAALREAIGEYLDVPPASVVCGAGSDELIDLVARMVLAPGDPLVDCPPTFGMYRFTAGVVGARTVEVPRTEDFDLDLPRIAAAVRETGARLIFVASPNNPSGNLLEREVLDELLGLDLLVVLDEAYAEFADRSYVRLVAERENLAVLRTFSKWAGLAGLRLGYGVFPDWLAQRLMVMKQPYTPNAAAHVAGVASLRDRGTLLERVSLIKRERDVLTERLAQFSFLQPLPSSANFILCAVSGLKAGRLRDLLRERGIFTRYFDRPELEDYLRISVARPEDSRRLIAALEEIQELMP